jgi:hypothetical protein
MNNPFGKTAGGKTFLGALGNVRCTSNRQFALTQRGKPGADMAPHVLKQIFNAHEKGFSNLIDCVQFTARHGT